MVVGQGNAASVTIAASQNKVCAGTQVTLTATPVNGGTTPTYRWYLNNVLAATGPSGTYAPTNGDLIYVVMTSSLPSVIGSPATSNVITMIVNPVSVGGSVTGGSTICSGSNSGILTLSGKTGTVVKWQRSVSPFSAWTDIANTATTYTSGALTQTTQFRAVVQSGNCAVANSTATTVTVNTIPAQPGNFTQSTAIVTQGQTNVRYTVPSVAGVTYLWSYSGTGATITGTSNSVLVSFSSTATSGTLSVRASNSCGASNARSLAITVNASTLKSGNLSSPVTIDAPAAPTIELKVYPNPSRGPVTFDFKVSVNAKVTLDIFSTSGQRITRIFDADVDADVMQTVIFNSSVAPGTYLYILRWNNEVVTGKFIIIR